MNWSDKQNTIFTEWKTTRNNLAIEAAPGSGKSTVLLEILNITPPFKKSIFLAFNKSIKEELETKVPTGVETSTLHSMGFKILLRNTSNKYKVNEIKNWILGKKILKLNIKDPNKQNVYLFTVSKLVDLYRLNMCTTIKELSDISDRHNISITNGELQHAMELIEYLKKYNCMEHEKPMLIDFVDMIYLPNVLFDKDKFPKYDIVLIDECQDLNPCQWELVQKLFKRRTRFCAVGDSYQAIYHFQGSNRNVFENIKKYENTITLPLSYSYRCSKKIVEEANKVFNFIESPEGKEEGEVVYNGSLEDVKGGDFILCRNNLPLIETFLNLLKQNKKSHILGRDYGKGLLNVLNKIENFEKDSINELLKSKENSLKEKGVKNPKNNQGYQDLVEKISILSMLHKEFLSINKLKQIIEGMFNDDSTKNSIILSSIHKSKGLEADNVYFLKPELIPSQYAESVEEIYAEHCLNYVAITRAKKKLVYVK